MEGYCGFSCFAGPNIPSMTCLTAIGTGVFTTVGSISAAYFISATLLSMIPDIMMRQDLFGIFAFAFAFAFDKSIFTKL